MTVHPHLPDVSAPPHSDTLPGFGAFSVLGALTGCGALTGFRALAGCGAMARLDALAGSVR